MKEPIIQLYSSAYLARIGITSASDGMSTGSVPGSQVSLKRVAPSYSMRPATRTSKRWFLPSSKRPSLAQVVSPGFGAIPRARAAFVRVIECSSTRTSKRIGPASRASPQLSMDWNSPDSATMNLRPTTSMRLPAAWMGVHG